MTYIFILAFILVLGAQMWATNKYRQWVEALPIEERKKFIKSFNQGY